MQIANRLTCSKCGKEFNRKPSHVNTSGRNYCSKACSGIGAPKTGYFQACKACGKEFYVHQSDVAKAKRNGGRPPLFCSHKCKGERISEVKKGSITSEHQKALQSAKMKGREFPHKRKPPITLPCLGCGETFTLSGRMRYQSKFRRFCDTSCWYEYLRQHPEAAGNFKGGIEPYYGPNWNHQAKQARDRDNHTCQECGLHQFNPRLNVHHKRPRREFNGDHMAANALDNLITLCASCHIKAEPRGHSVHASA